MRFHGPTGSTSPQKKAQQAHPVLKKNRMKNGISWLKTGYRKYRLTNALPFFIPLLVHSVPFSVPFSFIMEKTKTDRKNGIRLRTKRDLSRPFSSLVLTHPMVLLDDEAQVEARFNLFGDSANLDNR
jgi:hypothetical protein